MTVFVYGLGVFGNLRQSSLSCHHLPPSTSDQIKTSPGGSTEVSRMLEGGEINFTLSQILFYLTKNVITNYTSYLCCREWALGETRLVDYTRIRIMNRATSLLKGVLWLYVCLTYTTPRVLLFLMNKYSYLGCVSSQCHTCPHSLLSLSSPDFFS